MAPSLDYGRRLIPQILDDLAVEEPDRVIYSLAKSSDISQGFREVTARAFVQAVDKTAWWLRGNVGETTSIESVGYIGPHDLRHILLTYASVKAGCTALFLSPKNSTEGALAVLKAANCKIWVQPQETRRLALVDDFLAKWPMEVLQLPTLDELLDAEGTESFAYTKTFGEATRDPFCLLHTSGSTGLPKPIPWSHGLIGTMDAVRLLPPVKGDGGMAPWTDDWKDGDRIYSSFPMSHGAGIIMNILLPALFRMHCIMGPVGVIPNMNLIESLADHAKLDIWSMVPSLVDELGETLDVLVKFHSSKFICASGGPVSPLSAGKVNKVIRVLNLTGTTEGLFIGNLVVDREDWLYFAFHPYSGFEFKEVEPGIFEHWVHRNEQWPLFQGIFHTFPDQTSINLKDLYVKHPSKPDLWAYKGRNDDVVVLSNGYKISPLDTEALVTTHPAVEGCLMMGSGKAQAGLLIELKDPNPALRTNELFDSVWEIVERANNLSLHKNQLAKDFIAFTEPDKPFIRTDKGTVKRRATLELYHDFVERFYQTRSDEADAQYTFRMDTSSVESIKAALKVMFGELLPQFANMATDTDVFALGLDSLLVFRVIKSIRLATGLKHKISARHLYANTTLDKFAQAIYRLVLDNAQTNGHIEDKPVNEKVANMHKMLAKHRARLDFKANPCDLMNPNLYVGMNFYFPLREDTSFEQAFAKLQKGLIRTMEMIPILEGKVARCDEKDMGYKKGDLRVTLPPMPSSATPGLNEIPASGPPQFKFKDLSKILPTYAELKAKSFVASSFKDSLVLDGEWFPTLPANVLAAQANFVEGGCILVTNFHHSCFDGIGAVTAVKLWAENCRFLDGDESATCAWLEPDSLNRSLPYVLYEQEGYARPASEVDPRVWGYLGFADPAETVDGVTTVNGVKLVDGLKADGTRMNGTVKIDAPSPLGLPDPPYFHRKFAWPPLPPKDGRHLTSSTFIISPENVQKLKEEVMADPAAKGEITSVNDIVQAFFWRAALRARYNVATKLRGETFGPDDMSILELAIDARPFFSTLLPASYMGNLLVTNRPYLPVNTLCSPETSVGAVAYLIREAAKNISPALVHDAFTLLQSIPDFSMLTNACMGLESMHVMLTNMILFETNEISFGGGFFAGVGAPDAMRPQLDRFNTAFRLLILLPMRKDGAVELLVGTLPEEFDALTGDEEFSKYATFLG